MVVRIRGINYTDLLDERTTHEIFTTDKPVKAQRD